MLHQFFETGEFHIFRRNTVDGREAASVVNIHTVQEFFYRGFMNENFKIFRRVYVIVDDTVISGVNAEVLEADPVDTDDIARTGMEHVFFFRFQIQYVPCFRYDDIQREKDGIKKDGEEADNL